MKSNFMLKQKSRYLWNTCLCSNHHEHSI